MIFLLGAWRPWLPWPVAAVSHIVLIVSSEVKRLLPRPDDPPQPHQQASQKRKLAAILHADVVAFSRLMGEDEAGTHQALGRLRRAVDPQILAQGGRIVVTAGDSVLADFSSVVEALTCALEIQRAARAINDTMPPDRRLELRIGVNLGDVIVDGDDIFGDGVNIAARLQALAKPGTVCISQTVYEHVRNKLPFRYRSLGSHRVKNIAEPVRAYAVEETGTAPRRQRTRWPLVAATGAAAMLVAGACVWALRPDVASYFFDLGAASKPVEVATLASAARLEARPSVAVLPFKNLSGDIAHDYFSNGITEDVIAALGRFSNLLVISKSSSFRFKDSDAAPAEIGRLLNARYLLDGSIRRSGSRVRVSVQLTEATTGRLVWSETYNAEITDIFDVESIITKRVVGAAAVELTRFERERALAKPTNNLAAYEFVLRGRGALSHDTRDSNDEASALFQRAIDLDPNYADAYAALGGAYYEAIVSGWSEFRVQDLERAEALAHKALALDATTTRAYQVLSFINLFRKRFDLALAQIDRALEFNPSDADNYAYRGSILTWEGRAAEALPWLEGALRFDRANNVAATSLCVAYYLLHRYTEAVDACDRSLSRNPGRNTQLNTRSVLSATYAELGRQQDAMREHAIVARMSPFHDARTFANQFGTEEARKHMFEGMKKAGFR
jgi:adenylate cyclase